MGRAPLALLALLASLASLVPARADLVYVLNSGEASISVLDSETRSEIRRIPVLREPHHLMMSLDGRELMVADSAGNEMLWLNPDTAEVLRRERISNPYHLAYSPDGKLLVVNSLRRGQVDIYDAAQLKLLARLPAPTQPSHIAFSPDSRYAYITLQGTRGLMAIDLNERRAAWTLDVGPDPAGVLWVNDRLLVGTMGSDQVVVVNPAEQRVERGITTARGAHTVWLSPDGNTIYANSRVDSAITLLDARTLEVKGRWDIPGGPDDISFAPDGKLWVTLRWIARVAVVNPADGSYELIRVGRSPHGILVHPTPPRQPVAAADPAAPPPVAPAPARASPPPVAPPGAPPVGILPPPGALNAPAHAPLTAPVNAPAAGPERAAAPGEGLTLRPPALLGTAHAAALEPLEDEEPPPGPLAFVVPIVPPSSAPPAPPARRWWWQNLSWR